ncbi:MAG TPA: hypothetical protein VIL54_05015, partial [Natronosporangium sp.]
MTSGSSRNATAVPAATATTGATTSNGSMPRPPTLRGVTACPYCRSCSHASAAIPTSATSRPARSSVARPGRSRARRSATQVRPARTVGSTSARAHPAAADTATAHASGGPTQPYGARSAARPSPRSPARPSATRTS